MRTKEEAGQYFYPYWLLHITASVKLPFVPERGGDVFIAVDAVTDQPMVTQRFETEVTDVDEDEMIKPVVEPLSFDRDRFHQILRGTLNKRMKLLGNISYEERSVQLVYKKTLLWRSNFSEGGIMRLIALDTVTGEYGIVRMEDIGPINMKGDRR
ncbi:MAG: hypothetical protein PHP80_04460 [Synergistaceae bacterium]|uniref:hypothetical protein n=1 Tax=Aminivibrio sp. TaxID=1872489 RepID=UPI00345E29BB|nr:hypothetical protein [Synergistaceae bacterium]